MYDQVVSYFAGGFVHVDIMPIDPSDPQNSMVFTNYMGENFSGSINAKQLYNNKENVALLMEQTDKEYEDLLAYLHALCEHHIPYNFTDLAFEFMPSALVHGVISDVSSEDPGDISKLFCSQAILLALRNSVQENSMLHNTLKKANSRLTMPMDLYYTLRPFARHVCCDDLRQGKVTFTTVPQLL